VLYEHVRDIFRKKKDGKRVQPENIEKNISQKGRSELSSTH
jgi:hypothetical protein